MLSGMRAVIYREAIKEPLNKLAFFLAEVEFTEDILGTGSDAAVELCERWV